MKKNKTLGELASLRTGPFGSQLHAYEYTESGVPVVMPKDMINGRINRNTTAFIKPERARSLKSHICSKGDLLFSRRGDIGRSAIVSDAEEGCLCGTGCLRVVFKENSIPEFFAEFCRLPHSIDWLKRNAGTVSINISKI